MKIRHSLVQLALVVCLVGWGVSVFGKSSKPKVRVPSSPSKTSLWMSCESCHVTASWSQIKPNVAFNHGVTGFPLHGSHKGVLCNRCHGTSRRNKKNKKSRAHRRRRTNHFSGKKRIRACVDCHRSPHNQTVSRSCQTCHNTRTWKRTQAFAAHQRTQFPLTGAHASLQCVSCHIQKEQNKFRKLPTRCVSCHLRDSVKPGTHPNHQTAGFSQQCTQCHSTFAWRPARVNHTLFFPLIGAHQKANCSKCHLNNRYKGTPKTCISNGCHADDYKNAGHTPATFSTNCLNCHSQNAWKPVTFNSTGKALISHESSFPIARGNHSGFQCKQCHLTAMKRGSFTCTASCHTKARMDKGHLGKVIGYVYESRKCKDCHPQGTQ